MFKRLLQFITMLTLLLYVLPAVGQVNVKAAKALIGRIIPKEAGHFEVAYIPKEGNEDVFEIQSIHGKIVLRGNNGVSIASALYYYLRHYCHCLITWNGTNLNLPKPLPVVEKVIHKTSPYRYRYYLNYCTFNYTMSWWDWNRWQKEIDWMALNGINMPLALTGENEILQKVYKILGFTNSELNNFFPGPAYFAWFWMNNLDCWDGPLPKHWIETHEALQKKILARERALGMTPVLPAFTGHVPPAFKEKFPQAKVNKISWGGRFPPVNILSPEDSLFTVIGKDFLKEQTKEYGSNHFYSADIFNEVTPPSADSMYLNNISRKVYQSMHAVDSSAVWVMQGWLFYSDSKFWKPEQIKALLNAVPDKNMIILDLWSEWHPVWNRTEAYYGKPWIWNMLHNFGERTYLEGSMPAVIQQPVDLLHDSKAGKLTGLGLTMEGTDQNPVIYQLMLDNTWKHHSIILNRWIKNYVHQRYGQINEDALKAWTYLESSVYAHHPKGFGGPESVIIMRPHFLNFKNTKDVFGYSFDTLFKAWQLLLKASPALHNNDGYQYDLINTGRQVLADYAVILEEKCADAYHDGNIKKFQQLSTQYLMLLNDMDNLLAARKDFLLGKWIHEAENCGKTPAERKLYELNAKDLITLWGDASSTLHDYAAKQWSGLLNSFYESRWKIFFHYVDSCMENNTPLNMPDINKHIVSWEWTWVKSDTPYRTTPIGNPVTVSEVMYRKYAPIIQDLH